MSRCVFQSLVRPILAGVLCLGVLDLGVRCLAAAEPAPAAPAAPAANLPAFTRWVIASDYTRDGAQLLTAGGESLLYRPGDVVVWNPADGNRVADLAGHPTAVWAVKASKDGKLAATAGYDGLVKLWDLPARTLKNDLKKHKGWVRSLDFSADGSKLATAGEDGTVVVWDTSNGSELKTIAAHGGPVTSVAFSPDGATLATGGGDKLVKLWDVAGGNEKAKLEGHSDALWTVVYSPDGTKLATAGADRLVKIWNAADNKELACLTGHKDWVTCAAFTPDGARLATGSLDGGVKFWDLYAKAEQYGPEAVKSSVWSVAIHPDGKSMFVGSHAGGRLVPIPEPKLVPPPPPPPAPPAPQWVALIPAEFKSLAGATGAIAADGIVTVSGNLAKDIYTIRSTAPAGGAVKGIRLEALSDPSLPAQGPGRSPNGNFVVSKVVLLHGPAGGTSTPNPVGFAAAKADFEQAGYVAAGTLDDNPDTGWAVAEGIGKDHTLTLELPADVVIPGGSLLAVTIDQQFVDGTHALGKFRVAVLQEGAVVPTPAPAEAPKP